MLAIGDRDALHKQGALVDADTSIQCLSIDYQISLQEWDMNATLQQIMRDSIMAAMHMSPADVLVLKASSSARRLLAEGIQIACMAALSPQTYAANAGVAMGVLQASIVDNLVAAGAPSMVVVRILQTSTVEPQSTAQPQTTAVEQRTTVNVTRPSSTPPQSNDSGVAALIGGIVGGILLVLAVFVVVTAYYRYRRE